MLGPGSRSARASALAALARDTRVSCPGRASVSERRSGTQGPHDDWEIRPMPICDSPALAGGGGRPSACGSPRRAMLTPLLGLDVGGADHLAPLFGVSGDELGELAARLR